VTAEAVDPTRRLAPVVRLAPAKLNLTLAVVGRRPDGYHSLHSVMVPLALADRLSLAILPTPGATDTLHVQGFEPGPAEDNLALRAVAAARRAVGADWAAPPGPAGPAPALAIRLEKRIPVAAGLAGGSSDAAAALDGTLEAWGASIPTDELLRVAADLGSDVPFFLCRGPGLVEGRGERVTGLHGLRDPHLADGSIQPPGILLVTSRVPARTADVFGAWSAGAMGEPGVVRRTSEHFASEFGSGLTVRQLLERAAVLASANDLVPAAASVVPGLVDLRRRLTRILARPIGMSGSGPTLWALYPSIDEAARAAGVAEEALDDGTVPFPGDEPPLVIPTSILVQPGSYR
jgi:4-diphosphocytidyl-2-C-methyl-D-erythritol kinase